MANAIMIGINIQGADVINCAEYSVIDNIPMLTTTATPRLRQHHGRGGRKNVRAGEGDKKSSEAVLWVWRDCFTRNSQYPGLPAQNQACQKCQHGGERAC